jgi:hypothetical protein
MAAFLKIPLGMTPYKASMLVWGVAGTPVARASDGLQYAIQVQGRSGWKTIRYFPPHDYDPVPATQANPPARFDLAIVFVRHREYADSWAAQFLKVEDEVRYLELLPHMKLTEGA